MNESIKILKNFISQRQLRVMLELSKGEEGEFFIEKIKEMASLIEKMPKTGDNDEVESLDQLVAYLHYFCGGFDWYVTEKDIDTDNEGQIQAFGHANLGDPQNAEFGYLCLPELFSVDAELDLHFKPTTIAELKAQGKIP